MLQGKGVIFRTLYSYRTEAFRLWSFRNISKLSDYQSTLRVFYSFTVSFYHSTISVLINRQLQSGITFVVMHCLS